VSEGQTAKTSAWLYGLHQNGENRTNLALINTGEDGDSEDVFSIEIYDGDLASKVRTLEGIAVKARQWNQLNTVLKEAPGTLQGCARVIRTSGTNPFIAYAVTMMVRPAARGAVTPPASPCKERSREPAGRLSFRERLARSARAATRKPSAGVDNPNPRTENDYT
jgi:hypothetical protein